MIKNIVTSDYAEVVIKMKDNYYLRDFVQALLKSGYTISQSSNDDNDDVNVHIRYNNESDLQEDNNEV